MLGSDPTFRFTRWLYLRALALVNLGAFGSLLVQWAGLFGPQGILPSEQGPLPLWVGLVSSGLLLLDFCPPVTLFLTWLCYLLAVRAGGPFLSFQWDFLLLETDFLSLMLTPWQLLPRRPSQAPAPAAAAVFLPRWLLFRLMLLSGLVKLLSGDPTWRQLTALDYHYWTQPLPNPVAWYAAQLPAWVQSVSVVVLLLIELGVPWLIFLRRTRLWAFFPLAGLQLLIMLTGNYGFFNFLTLVLCLALLDDRVWPLSLLEPPVEPRRWAVWMAVPLVLLSLPGVPQPAFVRELALSSQYGLFAVMTTQRYEIELEGSQDGQTWRPYLFRYKPGPVERPPPLTGVHMPRLDWQMWFAALGPPEQSPWLFALARRLLQGSPEVLALLQEDPFPGHPPLYVRARLYDYRLGRDTWWRRQELGPYFGPLRLRSVDVPVTEPGR